MSLMVSRGELSQSGSTWQHYSGEWITASYAEIFQIWTNVATQTLRPLALCLFVVTWGHGIFHVGSRNCGWSSCPSQFAADATVCFVGRSCLPASGRGGSPTAALYHHQQRTGRGGKLCFQQKIMSWNWISTSECRKIEKMCFPQKTVLKPMHKILIIIIIIIMTETLDCLDYNCSHTI